MIRSLPTLKSAAPESDLRRSDGYSLVELLISLLLMTMLLGGLATTLFQSQATYEAQSAAADLRQTARVATETLARELRMAGADIGNLPQAVFRAGAYGVSFAADIDNDSPAAPCSAAFENAVDGGAERVVYSLASGTLNRRLDCWDGTNWTVEYGDQAVAGNLTNATVTRPIFRYFDEDGVEMVPPVAGSLTTAERDAIRVIEITLVLDDGRQYILADGIVDFEITTQVKLRNAGIE